MAKRRHTKAPTRSGKRSAISSNIAPVANSNAVPSNAMAPVKEEKQPEEVTLDETPATTDDELVCAICKEFYREPKLLQCAHTFCGGCIGQLKQHQNHHPAIVCPICRYITKAGADGKFKLLRNHIVEEKVKWNEVESKRETKELKCAECEAEVASKLCTDCPLKLCDFCASFHKRCIRFKEHSVVSIEGVSNEELFERKPEQCSEHAQELKLFCETCQVTACSDCVHSMSHRQHLFLALSEVMDKQLTSLNKSLVDTENCCKSYEDRLREAELFSTKAKKEQEVSKKLVEDSFTDLIDILQNEKRKVLDWIDKDGELLDSTFKLAKEKLSHVKSVVSYLKEVSRHPKEQVFDVAKEGMSQLQGYTERMAVSNRPSANPVSKKQDATTDSKNEFDVVLQSSHVETNVRFLNIRSALQDIGVLLQGEMPNPPLSRPRSNGGFKLIKSMFPMPEGNVIFRVPSVSKISGFTESQSVEIGNFLWRVMVYKQKNKHFDEDDAAGCYMKCESVDPHIASGMCRARIEMVLKSSKPTGQDYSFGESNPSEFQVNTRLDTWGKDFKAAGLSWKSLEDKGLVSSDAMEIHATVKIESWENGSARKVLKN